MRQRAHPSIHLNTCPIEFNFTGGHQITHAFPKHPIHTLGLVAGFGGTLRLGSLCNAICSDYHGRFWTLLRLLGCHKIMNAYTFCSLSPVFAVFIHGMATISSSVVHSVVTNYHLSWSGNLLCSHRGSRTVINSNFKVISCSFFLFENEFLQVCFMLPICYNFPCYWHSDNFQRICIMTSNFANDERIVPSLEDLFRFIHSRNYILSSDHPIIHDVILYDLHQTTFRSSGINFPMKSTYTKRKGKISYSPIGNHEKGWMIGLDPFMSEVLGNQSDLKLIYFLVSRESWSRTNYTVSYGSAWLTVWEGFNVVNPLKVHSNNLISDCNNEEHHRFFFFFISLN